MATALYVSSQASRVSRGVNTTNKSGSAVPWKAFALTLHSSNTSGTDTTRADTSPAGPTSGMEVGGAALPYEWISPPVSESVTISGTVTVNARAIESNMNANATISCRCERLDNTLAVVSTIFDSSFGSEVATSGGTLSWTLTPTSTTMARGDRFRVTYYWDDATALTMASGHTLTFYYDNGYNSSPQSRIDFSETFTFDVAYLTRFVDGIGTATLSGVCYGDGKWLVGVQTTNSIIWSNDDFITRSYTNSGLTNGCRAITYGGADDKFVAVGDGGLIAISSTGEAGSWSNPSSGTTDPLYGVCYSSGLDLFVACSGNEGRLITSSDASTWGQAAAIGTGVQLYDVQYGGGVFIASGLNTGTNTGVIVTSTDGASWTTITGLPTGNLGFNHLAYDSTLDTWWVTGVSGRLCYSTDDGATWNTILAQADNYSPKAVAASGTGVMVGFDFSGGGHYLHSVNGTTFARGFFDSFSGQTAVRGTYGNGKFCFVGSYGHVWLSTSGHVSNTAAGRTVTFLTATASDIVDQGSVEQKVWTARGAD